MTREIQLSNGGFALVDDDVYADLIRFTWTRTVKGYAVRVLPGERGKVEFMHRRIYGPMPEGKSQLDHRNRCRLGNRRANLRPCTNAENARNAGVRRDNVSGVRGVNFHKATGKWRAFISIGGKAKHLGTFEDARLAKEFYDLAASLVFGEFAPIAV